MMNQQISNILSKPQVNIRTYSLLPNCQISYIYPIMKQLWRQLNEQEKDFYSKLALICSMPTDHISKGLLKKKNIQDNFKQEDLYLTCKYNQTNNLTPKILDKLHAYKDQQGNTCMHIAAEYGNTSMIKKLGEINSKAYCSMNHRKDNPLMHCLRHNEDHQLEETVILLARHTDLQIVDRDGKKAHQIQQPLMSQSRSRIIELLKDYTFKTYII